MFLRKLFQSVPIWLVLLSTPPLLHGEMIAAYFQPDDHSIRVVTLVRARKTESSQWVKYSRQTFYMHGDVIHIRYVLIRPDLCSKDELEDLNFQLDFSHGRVREWRGASGKTYACDRERLIAYLNYLYSLAILLPEAAESAASHPGDFTKSEDASYIYLKPKGSTEMGRAIKSIALIKGDSIQLASAEFMETSKNDGSTPKGSVKLTYDYHLPAADPRRWSKPPRKLVPIETTLGRNPFGDRMQYP